MSTYTHLIRNCIALYRALLLCAADCPIKIHLQQAKPLIGITFNSGWSYRTQVLPSCGPLAKPISHAFIIIYSLPSSSHLPLNCVECRVSLVARCCLLPRCYSRHTLSGLCFSVFQSFLIFPAALAQHSHLSHLISLSNFSYCNVY